MRKIVRRPDLPPAQAAAYTNVPANILKDAATFGLVDHWIGGEKAKHYHFYLDALEAIRAHPDQLVREVRALRRERDDEQREDDGERRTAEQLRELQITIVHLDQRLKELEEALA